MQWARAYQRRGWTVVLVRHRTKMPAQRGWAARRGPLGGSELLRDFGGVPTNIGIATGEVSGRLVDVDLDCDEAVVAASTLLPSTGLRSGRTNRPGSHYWYTLHPTAGMVAGGIPSLRFSIPGDLFGGPHPRPPEGVHRTPLHPQGEGGDAGRDDNAHECVLVELRYDGHQTIVEPSIHPSGDAVQWQATDDAKEVTALALLRAVGRVAAAALLARYWAPKGSRDECALVLTGALLRMGWTTAETDVFVRAVARAAGDEEWRRRGGKAVPISARLGDRPNAPTRGWPSVAELLAAPSGERVTTLARVWLGYGSETEPRTVHVGVHQTTGVHRTPLPTGGGVAAMGTSATQPAAGRAATSALPSPPQRRGDGGEDLPVARSTEESAWGVLVADVAESEVGWLWPGRIPLGMITLLDGDPGLGKSLVCADLAARVTRGLPMPDGAGAADPAGVILLSNEDSLSATIRPRLEAAGADLSRVIAEQTVTYTDPATGEPHQRPLVLPADVAVLEAAARRCGARLMIIDPLMAYLSANVNSWRDQDVRAALAPLARLAESTDAAVLVLRHLNKATALANALYRGGGSIGIIGAARSALLVAQAPDNERDRILAVNKSNLAGPQPALRYSVEFAAGARAATVVWHGATAYTARTLLSGHAAEPTIREAESFVVAQLSGGPLPSTELNLRASRAGFAARTVERARKNVKVGTFRVGFGKGGKVMAQLASAARAGEPEEGEGPAEGPADESAPTGVPPQSPPTRAGDRTGAPCVSGSHSPRRERGLGGEDSPARAGLQLVVEADDEDEDEDDWDELPFGYGDSDDDDDDADDEEAVPMPCTLRGGTHTFAGGRRDDGGRPICDVCGWTSLAEPRSAGSDTDPAA